MAGSVGVTGWRRGVDGYVGVSARSVVCAPPRREPEHGLIASPSWHRFALGGGQKSLAVPAPTLWARLCSEGSRLPRGGKGCRKRSRVWIQEFKKKQ